MAGVSCPVRSVGHPELICSWAGVVVSAAFSGKHHFLDVSCDWDQCLFLQLVGAGNPAARRENIPGGVCLRSFSLVKLFGILRRIHKVLPLSMTMSPIVRNGILSVRKKNGIMSATVPSIAKDLFAADGRLRLWRRTALEKTIGRSDFDKSPMIVPSMRMK